jgi:perosamine synthetase
MAVLVSDWLTCGPAVSRFESAVAKYCGVKHAIAVANGTAALHVACAALSIPVGSRGITSPLSFLASANCIAYCGGTPDFVDVDSKTYCLSAGKLEEYVKANGSPAVVIPVDFAGVPADLPAIRLLADRHGFPVIEDAAHSIGSRYESGGSNYACGSCRHTEMAILSFHPVKTITTGEGGMVLTNDDVLARRARMFSNHGIERESGSFTDWDIDTAGLIRKDKKTGAVKMNEQPAPWLYQQQVLGFNYRITDIQCALGLSQLGKIEGFIRRRREIVKTYNDAFCKHPELVIPSWQENTQPAFHLYVMRLKRGGKARYKMAQQLRELGIYAQVHYMPIYLQPWYRNQFGYGPGKCPECEKIYDSCLSLPLYPALTDKDVRRVIENVLSIADKLAGKD